MSALVETVSKEAQLPIPRAYSLEASSRSTMDRCPHAYIQQGWHLGPTREHAFVFYQDALRGFDRALAAQAAALTVTKLACSYDLPPGAGLRFRCSCKGPPRQGFLNPIR